MQRFWLNFRPSILIYHEIGLIWMTSDEGILGCMYGSKCQLEWHMHL